MSWLEPSAHDVAFVEKLSENNTLYRLMLVLALPQRIEPLLLRNTRLKFAPNSSTDLETTIWFHPMIHSRNAKAIVLRSGIAGALLARLIRDKDLAELNTEAIKFVEQHIAHWSEPDRVEFGLRLALRTNDNNALQRGMQRMLQTLIKLNTDSDRREFARWVKGALPTLSDKTKVSDELSWLYQYLSAALGSSTGQLFKRCVSQNPLPSWLIEALPPGKEREIALQMRPGVLECLSPSQGGHAITLSLPLPTPVLLHFDEQDNSRWESLWLGNTIRIPHPLKTLTLQTLNGKRYRLTMLSDDTSERLPESQSNNILLLVYLPEDKLQAEKIARWLLMRDIRVELVVQTQETSNANTAQTPVLRLWTKNAAQYWQRKAIDQTASPAGVLLRVDEQAELPVGFSQTQAQVLDLPGWQGEDEFDEAKQLLETVSALIKNQLIDPTDLPTETEGKASSKDKEEPEPVEHKPYAVQISTKKLGHRLIVRPITDQNIIHNATLIMLVKTRNSPNVMVREIRRIFKRYFPVNYILHLRVIPREIPFHRGFLGFRISNSASFSPRLYTGLNVSLSDELANTDMELWALVTPRSKVETAQKNFATLLEEINQANTSPKRRLEIGDLLAEMGDTRPGVGLAEYTVESDHTQECKALLEEISIVATEPPRRLEIGDTLAEWGDPRPGVGLDENGLPDIDWVEIPAGEFIYNDDKTRQTLELDTFYMARYPVTNMQYQSFIDAGGYEDDQWWQNIKKLRLQEPAWPQANRPRTNVNWYEAVAFCRWLSAQLGCEVRLPIEQEWEKAARGSDGLDYPWGDEYLADYANDNDSSKGEDNLPQTTAVGMYPHGSSPYGVEDMSGNVWDWCLNKYKTPEDIDIDISNDVRVLRGGSWFFYPVNVRASDRLHHYPGNRYDHYGFRLLCSLPFSER